MSLTSWLCSSTERLFTMPGGMAITTPSPVQLAWCRLLDGVPMGDVAEDVLVSESFGGRLPEPGPVDEVCLFGGIRGGKTALIACTAIKCSQTVDASPLMRGETFRIPIVSVKKDLAAQTFSHLRNAIVESPVLRDLLVRTPKEESLELRHPSGHTCEITVTAGSRAGGSVAARYLGAAIFDEFPRMLGSEDGVVNWDEMRGECQGRVLDGGLILNAGSPWAPYGPAYETFVERFGKPSSEMVVGKAKAYWLNPSWWTPARIEKYRRAPGNADKFVTNIEAEFAGQEEDLFSTFELAAATRDLPAALPPQYGASYSAAIDPGTRRNAWTLVVFTKEGGRIRGVLAKQWVGTKGDPLKPRQVLAELAETLRPYGIRDVISDQYHFDTLRELAEEHGINLIEVTMTEKERTERYQGFYLRVAEGLLELPPEPWLRTDLQRLRKRVTNSGVVIMLPHTSDGRHCDFAPPCVLATRVFIDDVKAAPPRLGTPEHDAMTEARMFDALKREAKRKGRHAYG